MLIVFLRVIEVVEVEVESWTIKLTQESSEYRHSMTTCTVIGVGRMIGKVFQCQREPRARSSRGLMAGIISEGMLP